MHQYSLFDPLPIGFPNWLIHLATLHLLSYHHFEEKLKCPLSLEIFLEIDHFHFSHNLPFRVPQEVWKVYIPPLKCEDSDIA